MGVSVSDLQMQAILSGWLTPLAADSRGRAGAALTKNSELPNAVCLAGWPTAKASDGMGGRTTATKGGGNSHLDLKVREAKIEQFAIRGKLTLMPDGWLSIGFCVETLPANQAGGPLNPEHSRWLMGLPPEWANCAPTETASMLKRRRNSAKSSKKSQMEYDL